MRVATLPPVIVVVALGSRAGVAGSELSRWCLLGETVFLAGLVIVFLRATS